MTWRERRLITILSTILLILTAAVLIVLGIRYRENRAAAENHTDDIAIGSTISNTPVALSYNNGMTTLSFSRDDADDVWYWDADQTFPLDDTVITDILKQLSAWKPQQTLSESLEDSGLSEPVASLTVTDADGSVASLLFGKTTTDGNSYYVRWEEDDTVYIIADTLYKFMEIPIYDMCVLPELPKLREHDIYSIAIRGADQEDATGSTTVLTAQQTGEGSAVTWRSSGANVSDAPSVRALLEDLTAMAFTKCVDFKPSDEAASICGFDLPEATVQISYVTENNAEQALKLIVGSCLPDNSGRYVRMNDDPTIYLLSGEMLDPLMQIATEGLEG